MAWWNIGDWWDRLWDFISGEIDEIISAAEDVLNIKEIFQDELSQVIQELKDATEESAEFIDRAKNLKKHVIRADVIFEFIDEIRTGELRDFATDVLGDLKDNVLTEVENAIHSGQSIGLVKTSGPIGVINKFIDCIKGIYKGYAILTAIVHALRSIVPIVQKIREKLEQFEDVILPQDRPKHKVTDPGYHYSRK